jgi:ELWxxDGT repeat protein
MKNQTLALLLSCIAPLALHAQTAHLVKDINSTTNANAASSSPGGFFGFGSRVFFAAWTPGAGRELWVTDGTQAGTTQVADLRSGSADSSPSRFTIVNDKLIFNARDSRGEELWMTDGTAAGTRLMADISPSSSMPGDRIVFHGKMLFSAHEPVNGRELWVTDGTPAGTRLFKDLRPGTESSEPQSFVLMNGLIYFVAGNALWKTDGTETGTVVVKDSVSAFALTVAGSRLFFNGYSAATGTEPWVSDGTEAGTHLLVDIGAGTASSTYYPMTAFGDRVLFAASDSEHGTELWISDGTAAGTRMVRDIYPGLYDSTTYPSIAILGGTAFFAATTPSTGAELWKTDGTEAGTMLVSDIVPGTAGSALAGLTTVGSRIFFVNWSGSSSLLWVTDGTTAGTQKVRTPEPTVGQSGNETLFTAVDGVIYFSGANPLNGFEPWKSDGTAAGTSMIANLARDSAPSSVPGNLRAAGDWVYFDAWDGLETHRPDGGDPRSIWRSDGTPEGTVELTDSVSYLSVPWPVGRSMFFSRNDALWISDGTAAGTKPASEFVSRFPGNPAIQFILGDTIMVSAAEKLWATTLASGSSAVSLDVSSGFGYFDFAGRLGYFAQNFISGFSLRTSDGTPAGTYTIARDFTGYAYGRKPAVMGGHLYFVNVGDGFPKLWTSDGTFQGTVVVRSLPGDTASLVTAGRKIFFVTTDHQLWVTDGTEAGTRTLPATPAGDLVVAVGDRVVFAASDSASGPELWVSDGTVDGTRLLRDIFPGATGSYPDKLTSVAGVVYLSANDGLHGYEVWVTDGTAEGTKLAADVQPGTEYSYPQDYVRAGEQIFFTATTSATGRELWALPLSPTPRLTIGDIRVSEGSSVATARFTVTLSSASAQNVTVEYATSDGSATGGSDYDAASGTLTFAAGQTSKQIDVQVRGDATAEGNESFFVTLRSPAGAVLEKTSAFAVIEDDDLTADVALTPDFSSLDSSSVFVDVENHGPGPATNLRGFATATPAIVAASSCASCPGFPFSLQSGESIRSYEYRWFGFQQYHTLTATARERDPVTSNNSIGWTKHDSMAMDALYLSPGLEANIWFYAFGNVASYGIESSNPAVVSVPGSFTVPVPAAPTSFVARGLAVGTATIRVFTPSGTVGTLQVDVVAPGTKPRWPGALVIFPDDYSARFDEQVSFRLYRPGTAPYTGLTATGLVTIKANGHEIGRVTLTPTSTSGSGGSLKVPYYVSDIGSNAITVDYGGDENFLPETATATWDFVSTRGAVTITGSAERNGTTAKIRIRMTGSPLAAPTGTLSVGEPGVIPTTQGVLTPTTTAGVAQADITFTNVPPGPHTLIITYAGDPHYLPSTQNMRITDERRRSIRH